MFEDIKGKTIIVTGAGQGIGFSVVKKMIEEGANVFACALKETKELNTLIEQNSNHIYPIYFDFADIETIKFSAQEIKKEIRNRDLQIDGLVNVAGMTIDASFPMVTQEQLHKVFQINFFSQISFMQYIVRFMQKNEGNEGQEKGSIVNFSSISAIDGNVGQLAYSAVKSSWIATTKTMSKELASKGIRVNAVAPGIIDTDMIKNTPEEALNEHLKLSSLGRKGSPEEVADTIVFLISDESKYITGQIIRIDGGIG